MSHPLAYSPHLPTQSHQQPTCAASCKRLRRWRSTNHHFRSPRVVRVGGDAEGNRVEATNQSAMAHGNASRMMLSALRDRKKLSYRVNQSCERCSRGCALAASRIYIKKTLTTQPSPRASFTKPRSPPLYLLQPDNLVAPYSIVLTSNLKLHGQRKRS